MKTKSPAHARLFNSIIRSILLNYQTLGLNLACVGHFHHIHTDTQLRIE